MYRTFGTYFPTFQQITAGYCIIIDNISQRKASFLGSTAQLRPWPPPQNPAEFLGGFSTISFFTG
jgi:hypothetical protein